MHFKTKQNKEIEKKNPFKKNEFESIFSPILLSERNMGIDYLYNILDHENPL